MSEFKGLTPRRISRLWFLWWIPCRIFGHDWPFEEGISNRCRLCGKRWKTGGASTGTHPPGKHDAHARAADLMPPILNGRDPECVPSCGELTLMAHEANGGHDPVRLGWCG